MRFDVTTIGEVMLRLSVGPGRRLETAAALDLQPGGAEANMAGVLARLGRRVAWVGGLPSSSLGRLAANSLRMAGVDLGGVVWRESGRIGTYYLEFSVPPRPTTAIYDRAGSCAATLGPDDLDWSYLLDSRLLYLTGITPALSAGCRALTAAAIARARAAGLSVIFDINYRQLLWSAAQAREALLELIEGVDLLLCSALDARRVFGCAGEPEDLLAGMAALSTARQVVLTVGERGVVAWDGKAVLRQQAVPVTIMDRLGAGDALAAGVIHGWLDGDLASGLRHGTLLAALALSQHGDMVVTTPEEVAALLGSAGGGLVR